MQEKLQYELKKYLSRKQMYNCLPFFFGPLHTTASSRLFSKKPIDMMASRWSLLV